MHGMKSDDLSFHLPPRLSKLDGRQWRNFEFEFVMSPMQALNAPVAQRTPAKQ